MNAPRPGADRLERRYRRLLACYPWEHRRVYEEEMLGVLLAGARPGQQHPSPADTADMLLAAVRLRARRSVTGLADARWRDAAAVAGLLTAIIGLAVQLRVLAFAILQWLRGTVSVPVPREDVVLAALWLAVVVAALAGTWRVAAGAGWLLVAGEGGLIVVGYSSWTPPAPIAIQLLLSAATAVALSAPVPARRCLTILGWRRLTAAVVTSAVGVSATIVVFGQLPSHGLLHWLGVRPLVTEFRIREYLVSSALGFLAVAGGPLLAALTLGGPVRRRVLAILVAPLTVLVGILTIETPEVKIPYLYSGPAQVLSIAPVTWLLLLAAPVAAVVVAIAAVHHREQRRRLLELGRTADRSRLGTDVPGADVHGADVHGAGSAKG
jgi:hypothetical protein